MEELDRREFMLGMGMITASLHSKRRAKAHSWNVGVIGHSGRGNYGHFLDMVWSDVPQAKIVAVADAQEKGLEFAAKRLGVTKCYRDYRRMLEDVKPDLVSVCPRWLDQHRDMVVAAAQSGAKGVFLEKPMCRSLIEADEMVRACEVSGTKLVIAHQTRYSAKLQVVKELIESGQIGRVLEMRARGKEDHRGGGEDLWVLGTHVLDLVHCLGGAPKRAFGVVRENGRPITASDVKEGNEGIGALAGDEVHAMYELESGITATFDSIRNAGSKPPRFGLKVLGTEGVIELYFDRPEVFLLQDPCWSPGLTGSQWEIVSSAGKGQPAPSDERDLRKLNVKAIQDLLGSIGTDRQPCAGLYTARIATEMIVAVFESQRLGRPVTFPLENRKNPLEMLLG